MQKNVVNKAQREVHAYVDLHNGAYVLLQIAHSMAQEPPPRSYFAAMSAMLLSAFTFEAYLNHLGSRTVPSWSKMERRSWHFKLAAISKSAGFTMNESERPGLTVRLLFEFRNAIAHGRSILLESSEIEAIEHMPPILTTRWEAFCTLENADQVGKDITEVITKLHNAAYPGEPPFISGSEFRSSRVI